MILKDSIKYRYATIEKLDYFGVLTYKKIIR